jgi:hypothetical protein
LLELPPEPQPTDLTFADMGYGDWILTGSSQEATYYFGLPIGWRLTKGAYIELHFTHSRLLNYDGSFLNIRFNDQPVATVALSEETSRNGELVVELPSSAVSAGESNRISVEAQMRPFNECTYANTWLLISSVSLLHLDHREQDARSLDLGFYPYPFDQRPDLADVLFVLPPQPWPEEWEEVLQLAATLGATAGGPNFAPAVALGDTWPETELSNYHIIAVGRPSRNPVLQQVNDQLPQPFLPGSDVIEQKLDEVIFRLPQATDLGYVQLIPSPWSETRAFLAVTGTTDEGRKWAAHVLTSSPWVLGGNLTLARGDEVSTVDTRRLTLGGVAMAVATAVPEMIPVAVVTATSTATPLSLELTPGISAMESTSSEETNRPAWLIPLVVMAGLAVVASFAIAFWQARRKKQS